MTYKAGDKVKVNGSIQEIENITQWDKDTQRYKFVGGQWMARNKKRSWENDTQIRRHLPSNRTHIKS